MVANRQLNTFILLFLSLVLFGQKDFKPGYVITHDSDTVYGKILYRSDNINKEMCVFIPDYNVSVQKDYSPADIRAYMLTDFKYYISKEVEVDGESELLFLEYLVDGIVNLYYFTSSGKAYYYIEKDGNLHQLSNNKVVTKNTAGDEFARNSNQYIGGLSYCFKDSPELSEEIKSTKFTHNSMIRITKDYHNSICSEYECVDYVKKSKTSLFIEPSIGFGYSFLKFRKSDGVATDLAPTLGVDFIFRTTQSQYAIDFSVGLSLKKDEFEGNFAVPNGIGRKEDYRVNIEQTVLKIPLQFTYSFRAKKVQPVLMGALVNGFMLNPNYEARVLSILYDGTELVQWKVDSKSRTYHFGFMLGGGIKYHLKNERSVQLSVKYDYLTTASESGYILDAMYVNSFVLSISYGFSVN